MSRRTRCVAGLAGALVLARVTLYWCAPGPYLSGEVAVIPEMLAYRAWWQRPLVLTAVLAAVATITYLLAWRVLRRRALLALAATAVVLVACRYGYTFLRQENVQEYQSCANCRSFLDGVLEAYAKAHDGWYPRGGADEWDSLARAIQDDTDVYFFTSHAQAGAAGRYWSETGSLNDEVCCYRYVEGLHSLDPPGLLVMYYDTAGYWECSHHPTEVLGRACMITEEPGWARWEFLAEPDFRKLLARTRRFLATREGPQTEALSRLKASLRLVLECEHTPPNRYRFTCHLDNVGSQDLRVTVLGSRAEEGILGHLGNLSSEPFDRDEPFDLPGAAGAEASAGGSRQFDWWVELLLDHLVAEGRVVGRVTTTRDSDLSTRHGSSTWRWEDSIGPCEEEGLREDDFLAQTAARIWTHLRVEADGMEPVELPLWTEPLRYAAEHPPVRESSTEARVATLIRALQAPEEETRRHAAAVLGLLRADAVPAVPALTRALERAREWMEFSAYASALGEIGPEAREAVPALIQALRRAIEDPEDLDTFVLREAAEALGKIGPAAREAVPALEEAHAAMKASGTIFTDEIEDALERIRAGQ